MKDLLKTNCFDVPEVMIVVGSCLKAMQPKAYEELEKISSDIYNISPKKKDIISFNSNNIFSRNFLYFSILSFNFAKFLDKLITSSGISINLLSTAT